MMRPNLPGRATHFAYARARTTLCGIPTGGVIAVRAKTLAHLGSAALRVNCKRCLNRLTERRINGNG